MDAVLAYDGTFYTDVTTLNVPPPSNPNAAASAAQTGFAPFGPLANQGAALMLGFNAGSNFPAVSNSSLGVWPALARAMPPPMPCGGGASPVYAPASIVWEYWAGSAWQPLKVLSDDTLAFTIPGFVRLLLPPAGQLVPATHGPENRRKSRLAARPARRNVLRNAARAGVGRRQRGGRAGGADRAE